MTAVFCAIGVLVLVVNAIVFCHLLVQSFKQGPVPTPDPVWLRLWLALNILISALIAFRALTWLYEGWAR